MSTKRLVITIEGSLFHGLEWADLYEEVADAVGAVMGDYLNYQVSTWNLSWGEDADA